MKRRPLRVAVLADTFPPRGHTGVGNAHYHLLAALKRQGLDARGEVFWEWPRALIWAAKAVLRPLLWLAALLRKPWARPGLRDELMVDLLGALGGWLALRRIQRWGPELIVVPDYGACAALWPRAWRQRCVMVAHSNPLRFLDQPLIGLRDPLDARLAWWLEARMSREAAGIVAPSAYMKRVFERDYPHRAPVQVIPNLLDQAVLARLPKSKLKGGRRLWVFIPGAGNQNKGSQFVLPLIRGLSKTRVGFVLSGHLPAWLKEPLKGLPETVTIHAPGDLGYEQNIGLLKACDLCISPTLIENFGMALLEAQACGLPVVTFDVGGNKELVADGQGGRVVPYADLPALIRESAKLLNDASKRQRWGRQAKARAARLFSARQSGARYKALLQRLAREPRRKDT